MSNTRKTQARSTKDPAVPFRTALAEETARLNELVAETLKALEAIRQIESVLFPSSPKPAPETRAKRTRGRPRGSGGRPLTDVILHVLSDGTERALRAVQGAVSLDLGERVDNAAVSAVLGQLVRRRRLVRHGTRGRYTYALKLTKEEAQAKLGAPFGDVVRPFDTGYILVGQEPNPQLIYAAPPATKAVL